MKKYVVFLFGLIIIVSCKNAISFRESYLKDHYKGVIIKMFRDPDNHEMSTFTIKTDSTNFDEVADIYSQSWNYAKIGDSIIKPADTLMIIIKKNDSTYKEFFMDQRFLE
jgi:hypothetical protein